MNKQLFAQTAPPPLRGRGRGCRAERRQWRMQRGGAPAAVEKIEQASSAKIFSGTARRWGQMRLRLLLERICAQYGFGFFVQEKSKFVSSTASDRKGVVKGESVPLDRVLPTFARTKVGPRRVGVQMNTFCKTPRRRRRPQTIPIGQACSLCLCKRLRAAEGDYNLDPKILLLTFHPGKATPPRAGQVPPGIVPPAAEYR